MKWYKHLTGSLDSPDIEEAIEVFGGDGYLVFFGTLEIMADEFNVETPGIITIPLKHLTKRLQLSKGKTLKILKFFGEKERVKCRLVYTLNGKYITLNSPKLKDLCDEWTQRQLRGNSGVKQEPLPPIEEEGDKEEDSTSEKPKRKVFQKPTAEEVSGYGKSIEFKVDGEHFIDYYETRGWMVGKSKMKSWQAAVRTWKRNGFKSNEPSEGGGRWTSG